MNIQLYNFSVGKVCAAVEDHVDMEAFTRAPTQVRMGWGGG